jgi:hypothetical protein
MCLIIDSTGTVIKDFFETRKEFSIVVERCLQGNPSGRPYGGTVGYFPVDTGAAVWYILRFQSRRLHDRMERGWAR